MKESSVRMMLMGVTLYPTLRVNNVLTTLHHWLEQNVPCLDGTIVDTNNSRCVGKQIAHTYILLHLIMFSV